MITAAALLFGGTVYAGGVMPGIVEQCFSSAEKLLSDYYAAIDLYEDMDLDACEMSPSLRTYAREKIDTLQYQKTVRGEDKEHYQSAFSLIDYQVKGDTIELFIRCDLSFRYIGADFDSGYGTAARMSFETIGAEPVLTDWTQADEYDAYVKGIDLGSDLRGQTVAATRGADMVSLQREYRQEYVAFYNELEQTMLGNNPHEPGPEDARETPGTTRAVSALNKSAIASWATNNCSRNPPSSGGAGVPYYDFSKVSGSYDCTNFVSHALLAGGAKPYNTGNASTGWYYVSLSNRSYSWSGVPNLYTFLVNNRTKGPGGSAQPYYEFNSGVTKPFDRGDILQFHNGSIWRHSTIITGFTPISSTSSVLEATVTGRSFAGNGGYQDNYKASSVYPGNSRRVVKLIGNYS